MRRRADGDAQRAVGDTRLQRQSVDERSRQRLLHGGGREVGIGNELQGRHGGHQHLTRVLRERRARVILDLDVVREQEPQQAGRITEKGQPLPAVAPFV